MENSKQYFDAWMKMQTQALDAWREQGERMMSFYRAATPGVSTNPFDVWRETAFKAFSSAMDGNALKDTLAKAFGSTEAMHKLYEVWQPILRAMQSPPFNADAYKDFMDPAKINQVVDQLFNFDPSAITQLQQQAAQFSAVYQQFGKPWSDAMAANLGILPLAAEGNPQALFKMFENMSKAFHGMAGRVFNAPTSDKNRETAELMARFVERLTTYTVCTIEYQQMMHKIATEATLEVMEKLATEAKKGGKAAEEAQRFETFFQMWIDINEKAFNKYFLSQEFSRLSNAVSDSGFAARKQYSALMETLLADLPIALRSEMDDLYKTIHELRKQVKKLESQIKERQS